MCWKERVDILDVVKYLRRERIEVELCFFFFIIGQLLNTVGRLLEIKVIAYTIKEGKS